MLHPDGGSVPRPHPGNTHGPMLLRQGAVRSCLAAHQGLLRFHHIDVADDFVEIGRRAIGSTGLPDALLVQKRAQPRRSRTKMSRKRAVSSSFSNCRGRGSVLLEEVEGLWPHARAHLGGLQLPARYLEEVIQGLRLHARDLTAVVPATHAHGVGNERAALERL